MINIQKNISREHLIELYDCVFTQVHSDSFKCDEMKDLIYDSDYSFLAIPKNNWKESLIKKLKELNYL